MDLTDQNIIENFLKTKDMNQFKFLVRRYQNRVYSLALRMLGNAEEAEEVVQDAFVRAHRNLKRFKHEASFSSWIMRIAHNLCMDVLRMKQRRQPFHFHAFNPQAAYEYDGPITNTVAITQIADRSACPAAHLESQEQEQVVSDSLFKLPVSQRSALVLHDIEGFSYQEIADIVGTSIGTVRSRIYYGRLKMKELLDPYFSFQNVCV